MCIYLASFAISIVNSKLFLLMAESYEDCTEGGAKFVDFSGVEFEYVNDTLFFLNGSTSKFQKT